ncbi:MAG: DNA repair protein RecO [Verrucomicrobiales bacterium]|nr:DNA repair protein RecO [Verrucomicrobiales bacterium]
MEERTTGVVLRIRPLTETSLIVHWLTAEAGRISTVARGARRPKSVFRGKLDLFHEADLTFRRSRTSDLHTLSEVVLRGTLATLRTDWRKLRQAAYGATLIELATEADTPVPEFWEEFRGFLRRVDAAPVSVLPVMALELRTLEILGLTPDLDRESLPEASRALAGELMGCAWEEMVEDDGARVPREVLEPLEKFLHGFLIFHLGRLPKGRSDALE